MEPYLQSVVETQRLPRKASKRTGKVIHLRLFIEANEESSWYGEMQESHFWHREQQIRKHEIIEVLCCSKDAEKFRYLENPVNGIGRIIRWDSRGKSKPGCKELSCCFKEFGLHPIGKGKPGRILTRRNDMVS